MTNLLTDEFLKPFFPFSHEDGYANMNHVAMALYAINDAMSSQLVDDLPK